MLMHAHRFDAAREHFERAVELEPNFTSAYGALGQLEMLRNDPAKAEHYFKIGLRADENNARLTANLGGVYLAQNDYDRAIQYLTRAVELDPNDANAYASLGRAYLGRGLVSFAEQALAKALALDPKLGAARRLLGEAQFKQGRHDDARATFEALRADPRHGAAAEASLGDVARARGDLAGAAAHYRASLGAAPKQPVVVDALVWCLLRLGQKRAAIDALRGLLELAPQHVAHWRRYAELLAEAGELDAAATAFGEAARRAPDDVELAKTHAAWLELTGRLDDAQAAAEHVLARAPGDLGSELIAVRAALRRGELLASRQRLAALDVANASPVARRNVALLRGQVADLLDDAPAAVAAWREAHDAFAQLPPPPALGPVPDALAAQVAAAQAAGAVGAGRHPDALLLGPPGSGVQLVAALLEDAGPVALLGDRFLRDGRRDGFAQADFARWRDGVPEEEARVFARRYARALRPFELAAERRVIDWLPQFDARFLPMIQRTFGATRLIAVVRDPRDALLNWLAFGSPHGWRLPDPDAGAAWLARAFEHLRFAREHAGMPVLFVDAGDVALDPAGHAARLAAFLGVAPWAPGARYAKHARALGGLAAQLPSGRHVGYQKALDAPLASLRALAVGLGYPS
jgi:tetratricopeptide (TPR) repeat protein